MSGPNVTPRKSALDKLSDKAASLPSPTYTIKFERLARKIAEKNRSARQKVRS